jgi:sterol desaturase/sphingolipid hydroxylase (fatty acid hydroxylase superfamily)
MKLNLIHYAIPAFVTLVVIESIVAAYHQRDWFERKDTFSSLAMGIGNVISGLFTKALVFGLYSIVYKFKLFEIDLTNTWVWVFLFFADDFTYYWHHRAGHEIRWFWASHSIHHSSEKYNLSTALRQTWTGNLGGGFLFWTWLLLLGYPPEAVFTMQQISLLYQFWIHTEAIDRFPRPIEWFFNTPSHHRVHHGSDFKYLDKNHGGTLIIWDRLFGTFQVEEEHPTYGLTTPINTYNPIKIAFFEWVQIAKDLMKPISWKARLMYLFAPPGWSHDGSTQTLKQAKRFLRNDNNDNTE